MATNDGADRASVFVTVGTTLFDPLIDAVSSREFLELISQPQYGGYTDINIQYGKGRCPEIAGDDGEGDGTFDRTLEFPADEAKDESSSIRTVRVRGYRFKPSLEADMRSADLIVSHAGAGSIMEGVALCAEDQASGGVKAGERQGEGTRARTKKKKLAVVINSLLMDDHQTELADAMGTRGYLHVVPDPSLLIRGDGRVLREIEEFSPEPFPGGDDGEFAALMDEHMGFVVREEAAATASADAKKRR